MDNDINLDKIVLRESMSPINTFLITLFACIFWNICNAIMFYHWWLPLYQEKGSIPIFNTLFFSIFIFVGLLLIFSVIYNFLSIFNPRIILELNTNKLVAGGNYNLSYKIMGNVQRLTDINITLIGHEIAASGAGRNRTQDDFIAYETTIYHEASNRLRSTGETALTICEDFMPSFSGKNNKIEWFIVATGNIPLWPNMNHEFPIEIFPNI